jgi:hypothetical protein
MKLVCCGKLRILNYQTTEMLRSSVFDTSKIASRKTKSYIRNIKPKWKNTSRKASKLQPEETNVSKRTWYLPPHPVFHPAKPGKIRIVYDAAVKCKGTSLNDELLHGPNLANEIIKVLLRFRKEEVVIAADIQEMFHQVKVP